MRLYLKKSRSNVNAIAEFDTNTKELTVLKGSVVSKTITQGTKFRGSRTIEKKRQGRVQDDRLTEDVHFKSASTAANFVTGSSTNGMTAWKNENGDTLKQILEMDKKNL